jgi:hypothetical protein
MCMVPLPFAGRQNWSYQKSWAITGGSWYSGYKTLTHPLCSRAQEDHPYNATQMKNHSGVAIDGGNSSRASCQGSTSRRRTSRTSGFQRHHTTPNTTHSLTQTSEAPSLVQQQIQAKMLGTTEGVLSAQEH